MKKIIIMLSAALVFLGFQAFAGNGDKHKTKNTTKMKTIQLTKSDFIKMVADYEATGGDWKYIGDKPAIIDFYADWCAPCRMVAPIMDELAEEYGHEIYVYKVDTQAEQELAGVFGIRSIPSILFIPMEGQPQMARGAMPKEAFKEIVEDVLLNRKVQGKSAE